MSLPWSGRRDDSDLDEAKGAKRTSSKFYSTWTSHTHPYCGRVQESRDCEWALYEWKSCQRQPASSHEKIKCPEYILHHCLCFRKRINQLLRCIRIKIFKKKNRNELSASMDRRRLNAPLFLLEQEVLTSRERQFVEAVKRYFFEHGKLTEQQESILKGIYREKIWMRKSSLCQNHLSKGSSSKMA